MTVGEATVEDRTVNTLWFYERPHPRGGDAEESWIYIPGYMGFVFWDYAVDGEWLYQLVARADGVNEDDAYWDWVTPFGLVSRAEQLASLDALAGLGPTNHDPGRQCIEACAVCADRLCGGLTATVEFRPQEVVWKDLAYEAFLGWDESRQSEWQRSEVLPLELQFDPVQYREAIEDLRRRIEATVFPWDEAGT